MDCQSPHQKGTEGDLHDRLHLFVCRSAESARDDNSTKLVAANTELKARRTAYDVLHTDWLASQQDLKAHRHVLARLDIMYACSVPSRFALPNRQQSL